MLEVLLLISCLSHRCDALHFRTLKSVLGAADRGVLIFQDGPQISVIFGPGGPNILGVLISRDRSNIGTKSGRFATLYRVVLSPRNIRISD